MDNPQAVADGEGPAPRSSSGASCRGEAREEPGRICPAGSSCRVRAGPGVLGREDAVIVMGALMVPRLPEIWYYGVMKTTLNLPDDVIRAVKLRALQENRTLQDTIAELLRRGLAHQPGRADATPRRVRLPLVQCTHAATDLQEMTPERVAETLLEEEARLHRVSL